MKKHIICARFSHETIGIYLKETIYDCNCMEYLNIQKLNTSEQIKFMHNGQMVLRTLQDICNERKFTIIACTVVKILT